jgi:tungstate transport system ATP-binding protein
MQEKDLSLICLQKIVHSYNRKTVLEIPQINFSKGRIYAVLGPNGSGKTTLLSILSLLLKPTSGKVLFEGKDVYAEPKNINDVRKKITTVIQNPVLFDTTVENNVDYGLRIRGAIKDERKNAVAECLNKVRLDGFQKRKAKELSGGEAQRVAIARALAIKPQVLFLDEFTSNIDEKSIEILESVIKTINKDFGSTVFLVTHDTQQAYRLADKVITLFEGKVIESSLENLLRGTITKLNGTSLLDTGMIKIEVVTDKEGLVYAAINPHDIILSLHQLHSSARNTFYGKISQIFDEGARISMKINVGEEFMVKITRKSLNEMKLTVGSTVCMTFKSTAVEIF